MPKHFLNHITNILVLFVSGFIIRYLFHTYIDPNIILDIFALLGVLSFNGNLYFLDNNSHTPSKLRFINKELSFKDKCRRKSHWIFLEQFDDKFKSYSAFKKEWDFNLKYSDLFREKYEEKKNKVILFKKTLLWFTNRRK